MLYRIFWALWGHSVFTKKKLLFVVVLRRIFSLNRNEIIGGWRKLHSEELHDVFSLPNIIRVVKSRMGWAE
jgi:hypothetical protein